MNEKTTHPAPPRGCGRAARRLWKSVVSRFELDPHELELLGRAVHVLDHCEELEAVVAAEGTMATGASGQPVVHPALVELRGQSLALARLLVALRIPTDEMDEPRLQRRGMRGVYGVRR